MARARWNGETIAASDRTQVVDGTTYFPPDAVRRQHLRDSERTSVCPWKGTARTFDVVASGAENPAAAWSYPETKQAARHIEGWVAFWRGVEVEP